MNDRMVTVLMIIGLMLVVIGYMFDIKIKWK